jgi:hypothetical protein
MASTGLDYGTMAVSLNVVMNIRVLQSEAGYFIGQLVVIIFSSRRK